MTTDQTQRPIYMATAMITMGVLSGPGLSAQSSLDMVPQAVRQGDVLMVWKLDRLGCNLTHLANPVRKQVKVPKPM